MFYLPAGAWLELEKELPLAICFKEGVHIICHEKKYFMTLKHDACSAERHL